MSDYADASQSIARAAASAADRLWHLLAPAIALIALAVVFSDSTLGLAFLLAGAALVCLVGLIYGLARRYRSTQNMIWQAAKALGKNDLSSCFGTDESGVICYRNPASLARFPVRADFLSEVVGDLFASPRAVFQRLQNKADAQGAAMEDVASTRRALRVSAHRIDGAGYFWRFEEREAIPDTNPAAQVALPMMRVAMPHKILEMNEAMHQFLGARPKHLDRIVSRLPLQSGDAAVFQTANGPVESQVAVLSESADVQHVYLWPATGVEIQQANANSIPVPMMRVSAEGEILSANARAQKLLALDDAQSIKFGEVIEGLGRPIDEWLLDVSEGRGIGRTEVVRANRPEQDIYLQVSLGRLVDRGNVTIIAVLIDATELKTLEAQFVQSQKMQAIGQLAGGVAHDFNNLLTAISGHCDLLLLRHEPGNPNYGDLVQINQNANRAASLVGQLLAFSRKQNMQPELIDLRDTLGDLTHLLNRLVGERITLKWSHDPDLPRVRADKRQLEQVLMNLVVNARDAMPNGGQVEINNHAEHLKEPMYRDRAEVPPGEYVVVTVCDKGCGIAEDKLQKIFEPFYSTKKTGEGTGLGLSMVYGIVKQSGGFIFADSVLGAGSTFTMYFPAHNKAEVVPAPIDASAAKFTPRLEGGHVLLVEDEAPVRAFASRALRLRGFTVTEAACAEDALELLDDKDLEVDVFVTDVVMPGMDGPTWVSKALEERPGVKVVFVSGYAEESVSHNRSKIPNSAFLPKPFSLSQLTETVQSQIS
ncbi:sensory box histidine kinase/response regulator [Candidatus Rhodobacter oscarellae]|uniref:histidine kinase n=1 Tax=Candidatus Rhodobacter oscarellae TaxID=1675527 RepID=A0A0J9E2A6_9RHOB|nr:ATP-binding protein [Candidatus Rhodobacter lobularis]KMW56865.1 sensory box histidine kinase/response regulator [Candidatus Rhodobacter lobularis]